MAVKQKKYILKEGHKVQHVLTLDGMKYFEFVDSNMAPCNRMFTAMTFYNELKMRCDRDYLTAHCQAVRDILSGKSGGVDLVQLGKLTLQLQERLEFILEPETALKYASVVIFDETEDPYAYDFKYNLEVKIPRWKKEDLGGFFLSMPVKKLFPHLNLSQDDLNQSLEIIKKIDQVHLKDILGTLSSQWLTADWYRSLQSRKQPESALPK